MNCKDLKDLILCLEIDNKVIYEFDDIVNEENMIANAKYIEELLLQNHAKPGKIQNVFVLLVEVMQNILSYSYGSTLTQDNKKEACGMLIISYKRENDTYMLHSCNIIEKEQENEIHKKLKTIEGLDSKKLGELARDKMRSKEDKHKNGAGLGFILMARKSIEPIEVDFSPWKDNLMQYKLKLTI